MTRKRWDDSFGCASLKNKNCFFLWIWVCLKIRRNVFGIIEFLDISIRIICIINKSKILVLQSVAPKIWLNSWYLLGQGLLSIWFSVACRVCFVILLQKILTWILKDEDLFALVVRWSRFAHYTSEQAKRSVSQTAFVFSVHLHHAKYAFAGKVCVPSSVQICSFRLIAQTRPEVEAVVVKRKREKILLGIVCCYCAAAFFWYHGFSASWQSKRESYQLKHGFTSSIFKLCYS